MKDMWSSKFKSMWADESGNVAMMFAGCATALLISIGAAIDYTKMAAEKNELQSYADAAVLAAAVSGETKKSKLKKVAQAALESQTDRKLKVKLKKIRLGESAGGDDDDDDDDGEKNAVRVTIKSDYKPMIMGAFGHGKKKMSALSESPLKGGMKLNLALVLDATKSMDGSRMTTLKSASADLLETLEDTAKKSNKKSKNIHVSFVPFADYVRIDPDLRGASWLNAEEDHEVTWDSLDRDASTGCRQQGSGELAKTVCDNEVYEEKTGTATWVGCMGSRRDGYHMEVNYGTRQMQGPAGHISCNSGYNIMQPLSTDFEEVNANIQAMGSKGKTYIPSGLIWGWRTLDRRLPFDEGKVSKVEETRDVLLLMTDGANTVSVSDPRPDRAYQGRYHYGEGNQATRTAAANVITAELCTAIKQDNIEIITVAFEIDDVETIALLRECASSPTMFYNAQSGAALTAAFDAIGSGFGKIRLSR